MPSVYLLKNRKTEAGWSVSERIKSFYRMDTTLPTDPLMLFSFINTKLRNQYTSLDALCDDYGVDKAELLAILAAAGFEYSEEYNKFW